MQRSFKQKVIDHPIIAAWFGIWAVVAGLNFSAGLVVGGYPIAIAFVCMAILGAYAAMTLDSAEGGRRTGLVVLVLLQLALGQWAGWQTLGLNLSHGAAGLESSATTHNSTSSALEQAKAERASLGTTRPPAAIEADEHLECESGVGPRCTALRRELANAQRALELDAQIPALVKDLGSGPQLTDAEAPFNVAKALGGLVAQVFTGGEKKTASRDDVIFWFSIFFTALLEFVGTCGPWLFQIGEKWADPKPRRVRQPFLDDDWDELPRRLTHQRIPESGEDLARLARPPAPNGNGTTVGAQPVLSHTYSAADASSPIGDGLDLPRQASASVPTNQHQHGAPITVNLYGQGGAQASPSQPTPLVPVDEIADRNVRALRSVSRRPMTPAIEQSVREAPPVPVDRGHLQVLLDSMIVFKASELVEQRGAWTEAAQVYQRYADWAQERGCSAEAFHTLFPAATHSEISVVGGVPHYASIALRRDTSKREAS